MCDENGLFSQNERPGKLAGVLRGVIAVAWCLFVLLIGVGILCGVVCVYDLLATTKMIVLPLGTTWSAEP